VCEVKGGLTKKEQFGEKGERQGKGMQVAKRRNEKYIHEKSLSGGNQIALDTNVWEEEKIDLIQEKEKVPRRHQGRHEGGGRNTEINVHTTVEGGVA